MRDVRHVLHGHPRNSVVSTVLAAAMLAIGAAGCATDTPNPAEPVIAETGRAADVSSQDENPIIVSSSAELVAALVPENAGRRIVVRAGDYNVTQPLTVPDDVTLGGEGVMQFDDARLPTGFAPGTRTTLTMTANVPGNVLTLGNGVTIRAIAIQDLAGRVGNSIGVISRSAGDSVFTTIEEVEIVNPTNHTIAPTGPSGCAVALFTQNPNLGSPPLPHSGAAIGSRVTRSLIRSNTIGTGCGVFAFNFASTASVSVALTGNVVVGGMILSGGVSRPDPVHDSRTAINSHRNLYRNDSPNQCAPQRLGWNAQGASGTPVPLQIGATERNVLSMHSVEDRIEGFTTGVFAVGGRRFFAAPIAGATNDNSVDLTLLGTTIMTPSCGGVSVTDLRLAGAIVSNATLVPGDGNTLRAVIRGVTGSGLRSNTYGDVLGPTGPVAPAFQGTGNRLEIAGNLQAFARTNQAIDPAPPPEFFTSGK